MDGLASKRLKVDEGIVWKRSWPPSMAKLMSSQGFLLGDKELINEMKDMLERSEDHAILICGGKALGLIRRKVLQMNDKISTGDEPDFVPTLAELTLLRDDYIYENLNVGHWKAVEPKWRQMYTLMTILQVVVRLIRHEPYEEVICECDKGLLFGEPILQNFLLVLTEEINKLMTVLSHSSDASQQLTLISTSSTEELIVYESVKLKNQWDNIFEIEKSVKPSVQQFYSIMQQQRPVLISKAVEHWPARVKWSVNYIKTHYGCRTVPVEIGSKYTSEEWTQKLMTIGEFITRYMGKLPAAEDNGQAKNVGYIAQHNLFEQIPSLKQDIITPEYCLLGNTENVEVNAWFGPASTTTPTHYDAKHNLLVQVFGTKLIRLYPPAATEYLNAFPSSSLLFNTSQLDLEDPNLLLSYPKIKSAEYTEFLLNPGEMLYLPPKYWHFVKSLTPSFSVSFWFE